MPALLFLTSYLSVWPDPGRADSRKPDGRRKPGSGPGRSLLAGWRSVGIAIAGCVAAALLLLSAPSGREGRVDLDGLRKIADLNPTSARAQYSLAICLEQAGRLDEAIDSYRSALRLRPDFAEAHLGEGNILFKKGAYDQAAGCYADVLKSQPGNMDARFNLATTLLNRGIFDLAARDYEAILRLNPDHASAHKGLGEALLRLNRRCEALPHLERSAALDERLASDPTLVANISILRSNCGRRQ